MRRERISEDIYIFTSEIYAQVTSSVILTDEGAIIIDTLPFPSESREMAKFVRNRSDSGVRYVINTHFHADHVYGNYLFPGTALIGHRKCRDTLLNVGQELLDEAKAETSGLDDVEIIPPHIVFDREMGIRLGHRILRLIHLPGHSPDGIGVLVEGDRVLLSGDAMMPIPYFALGDRATLRHTLKRILEMNLEGIVQGHGDVLLRGEIPEMVEQHIEYLDCIEERVQEVVDAGEPQAALLEIEPEDCGESSIPLDGLVRQLHQGNLVAIYEDLTAQAETTA